MHDMDVIDRDWKDWPDDKRLSVGQVAWMLKVGCQHVRRLIRQGRLGAKRQGHVYKIPVRCLKKYLRRQKAVKALRKAKR